MQAVLFVLRRDMKKQQLFDKAVKLRQQGKSYKEIRAELSIAKSTAHKWLRDVPISTDAIQRLLNAQRIGGAKGILSIHSKIAERNKIITENAKKQISAFQIDKNFSTIICSMLYWAEGAKKCGLKFMNSDPGMVSVFLKLLRIAFPIDENKLSATLHLHEYHDRDKQIAYWSNITGIKSEKIKIYLKKNTGLNKRPGYPGCINIQYYDSRILTHLQILYTEFVKVISLGA